MPFTLPAPSSLEDVFSMNPGAFYQGQQMLDGGMQQNQADLRASTLKNLFDEQNNPTRLRANELANQTSEAQLPGILADSDMKGLDRDRKSALQGDTIKAARTKFLSEATDAHLKELEDKGQEMAYSSDPAVAAQGQQILMHHKDIIKEREKQKYMADRQMDLEQLRGKNALARDAQQIGAGRFAPRGGGSGGGGSIEQQIASGKLSYEKAATLLSGAAFMADQEGDQEKADAYRQMADQYNQMLVASKRAGAQGSAEAKPDLNKMGIATNAPVPAPAFAPVGRKPGSQERIQQLLNSEPAAFSSPDVEARVRKAAGEAPAQDFTKKPVTEDEYSKLPAGTMYLHPDGKMKRKK